MIIDTSTRGLLNSNVAAPSTKTLQEDYNVEIEYAFSSTAELDNLPIDSLSFERESAERNRHTLVHELLKAQNRDGGDKLICLLKSQIAEDGIRLEGEHQRQK